MADGHAPASERSQVTRPQFVKLPRANPYVGLRPFRTDDAPYFFGRRPQITELMERLPRARFVPLLGAPGCGKTSLMLAGVVPALPTTPATAARDRWITALCRPGAAPLFQLARALLTVGGEPPGASTDEAAEALAQRLRTDGVDALWPLLRASANGNDSREGHGPLLLIVDQFEELLTATPPLGRTGDGSAIDLAVQQQRATDRAQRLADAQRFVALLLALTSASDVPVYVLCAIRSDVIGACDQFEGLPDRINRDGYLVPPLSDAQLTAAIEQPALLAGGQVAPELTQHLLAHGGGYPDLLPAVQHALYRSWDALRAADPSATVLESAHLDGVGGLALALPAHVEQLLTGYDRELVSRLFKRLTDTDVSGRRRRRSVRRQELRALLLPPDDTGTSPAGLPDVTGRRGAASARLDELLAALTQDGSNILTCVPDQTASNPRYELTSDCLLRQWLTLQTWMDEERALAEWFYAIADRAARYARGAEVELLPRPSWQLARQRLHSVISEAWIAGRYDDADAPLRLIQSFVEVSRGARLRRTVTRGGVAALLIAVVALVQFQITQAQAHIKKEQLKTSLYTSLQRFADTDPTYGAVLAGFVGVELSEDSLRESVSRLQDHPRALLELPRVTAAAILDSTHLITALTNGDVAIVTTTVPQQRIGALPRRSTAMPVTWLALRPNRTVVTVDAAGVVESFRLDNLRAPTALARRDSLGAAVVELRVSADSSAMAMRTADGRLRLWSSEANARPVLVADSQRVTAVAFAAVDGDRLVYASLRTDSAARRSGRLVAVSGLREVPVFTPIATDLPDSVRAVALPADGRVLAIVNTDVLEVRANGERSTLANYHPTGLAVSPDSLAQVLVGSVEGRVDVLFPGRLTTPVPFTQHADASSAVYLEGGRYVLSAAADNTLWWTSRDEPSRRYALLGHRAPVQAARAQSSHGLLITLDDDGRLRSWRPADWYQRYLLNGARSSVAPLLLSRFGERVLTTLAGSLVVEDSQRVRTAATLPASSVQLLAASPGGTSAVLGDSSAQRWSWSDRADVAAKPLVPLRAGFGANGMRYSTNGAVLFAVHADSSVSVLNAATMIERPLAAWGAVPVWSAPSLDSTGALVAYTDARGVQVRAVNSAQLVRQFSRSGAAPMVSQLLFPSGKRLLWMQADGRLQLRELARAADSVPRAPFTGAPGTRIETLAARADEYVFAYVTDKGGLYLLEVLPTSLRQVPLTMRLSNNDAVRHVAFDSTGLRLVATTAFGGVYVWELWWDAAASRMEARPLLQRTHTPRVPRTAPVQMAATVFSRDGKRLHSVMHLPGQPSRRMSWDLDANLVRQQADQWQSRCVDFASLFNEASREFTRDASTCRFDVSTAGPARQR